MCLQDRTGSEVGKGHQAPASHSGCYRPSGHQLPRRELIDYYAAREIAANGRDAAANASLPDVGVRNSKNFQDRQPLVPGEAAGKAEHHLTAEDQRKPRQEPRAVSGRSTANR